MRWGALRTVHGERDFLEGLFTVCGNGAIRQQAGITIDQYAFNRDMSERFSTTPMRKCSSFRSKARCVCARKWVCSKYRMLYIAVIPRGVKFQVRPPQAIPAESAAICAKTTAHRLSYPVWGRSAPMVWLIRAILKAPWQHLEIARRL